MGDDPLTGTARRSIGDEAFPRPSLPPGFDDSRAAERRAAPAGWRFPESARAALAAVIEARRDIRRFRPDAVPDDVLRRLLGAAHRAPSVGLTQPWRFIVIESAETRAAIRALAERERLRQAERFGERRRQFLDQTVEGILEPLLDLGLRLGEASGAALSLPLIEAAGRLHREMGTFSGSGVDRASS